MEMATSYWEMCGDGLAMHVDVESTCRPGSGQSGGGGGEGDVVSAE